MAELNLTRQEGLSCLLEGSSPGNPALLAETSVALAPLTDFLTRQYLDFYIPAGGSKIKLITGLRGSGKTFFAESMLSRAQQRQYRTVTISARRVWLHDFREVYLEILRQCDLEDVLRDCAAQIIRGMGYDPASIPEGKKLMDVLADRGEGDAFSRGEIRDALRKNFTRNPRLDNTFANCCSLLVGDLLGYPVLESAYRDLLLRWMYGDKSVRVAQMKALGLSPAKITKYNARHMLRSLAETVRMGGRPGLMIVIDDLEHLISPAAEDSIRYTKGRREDTYESIRQLIDDIDSMRHILFFLCMDRELMDNDSVGLKSYQALWLRVQNEVVSTRFNSFADIVDMDRYADENLGETDMVALSEKLARTLRETGADLVPLTAEDARQMKARAVFGKLGLPWLVNRFTVEGGNDHA